MSVSIVFVYMLACLSVYTVSGLNIPKGYILQLSATCSKSTSGKTVVNVVTDLDVFIEGECLGGHLAEFKTIDYVNWQMDAYYSGNTKKQCVMEKKKNSDVYLVYVTVSWARPGEAMLNHDLLQVTCVVSDHGAAKSAVKTVDPSLLGPKELQSHMGGKASSLFVLKLTDINGKELPNDVPLGRKVQLRAEMKGSKKPGGKDEVGLRAVSCDAIGGKSTYKILRGGCGDGLILPRNLGFTTTGKTIKSPVFSAFRLAQSSSVSFYCNFTSCKSSCDGDSCKIEGRRKRDSGEPIIIPLSVHAKVRSTDKDTTVEVDPCQIPGLMMDGCTNQASKIQPEFPLGVSIFMVTLIVLFPVLLIVGIVMYVCCARNKYGYSRADDREMILK